jgi:hypothetical protein
MLVHGVDQTCRDQYNDAANCLVNQDAIPGTPCIGDSEACDDPP